MKKVFKKIISALLSVNIVITTLLVYFLALPSPVLAECQNPTTNSGTYGKKTAFNARVGGVALDQAAKFLANMSDITGAYYDSTLDRIVFVGKKNTLAPKFDKDDLAVAIKAVIFNKTIPALSMENDPADPTGPNLKVYYYGGIEDTRFGKVLLDADFKMKLYVQGYVNGQKLVSQVPGYKSHFDRWLEKGPAQPFMPSGSRWWIVPQLITLKEDEVSSAFVFDTVKMEIKTEVTKADNDPKWNEAAQEFANQQTQLYDEFAKETPSYADAKQLGKIVAVIKWLSDNNIATDFHWARDYAPKIVTTPRTMPRQTSPWVTIGNNQYQINGGVEFSTNNEYSSDTTGESSSVKTSAQAVPTTKEDINWSFTKDGQQYEAVAVTADAFRSLGSYSTASTDLSIPTSGDLDLSFNRAYSSFSGSQQGIGRGWKFLPAQLFETKPGWTSSCATGLTGSHPSSLGVYTQTGGWESFIFKDCSSGYAPEDPAYHSKISHNSDGTFTLTLKNLVQYLFDSSYKLSKVKDISGNLINYNYDGAGKVVSIEDGKNHKLTLNYNNNGLVSSVSDWSNRTVGFTYDDQGSLLAVTDPNGGVTKYAYDANFKLNSITDRLGNLTTTNTYTGEAKLATQTNAEGLINTYAHDDSTKTITVSDNLGKVSKTQYDSKARVIQETDPLLQLLKYTYTTEFAPTSVTDKRGSKISYTYDANGNMSSTTFPDGRSINYKYDTKNRVTEISDNRYSTLTPKKTTFAYDVTTGKVAQVTEPNTTITKYSYDTYGEVLSITDPESKVTTWTRDTLGNPITEKDPNLNTTNFEYDLIGRLTKKTDPEGKFVSYGYDANGNIITAQDAAGQTKNEYDKENRLTKSTLPNLSVTQFGYNTSDSLTTTTDALSQLTSYGYDKYQNLLSQKDALNNTTTYIYDKLNRQTESQTPLGKIFKWEYDPNGNITKRIDANNNITSYTYDAFNRLTKITYPDLKTVSFTFDNRGNLTQMVDPIGTTTYSFDQFDRVTSMTNPYGSKVTYAYNKTDKLTRLTYPNNYYVDYAYDNAHRLINVKDWNLKDTKYSYYKNNLVSSRLYPNGIQTNYSYDGANRLSAIDHIKSTLSLAKFGYERDGVGNITKEIAEGSYIPSPKPVPQTSPTPSPTPTGTPNPNGSDLVVTGISLSPLSPSVGQNFNMTITVKNQGSASVIDKLIKVTTYIDLTVIPNYSTPYVYFNNVSVTLNPGESKNYSVSTANLERAGDHSVWAMVDQSNAVAESNENNNGFGPLNFKVSAAASPTPTASPSPRPVVSPTPTPVATSTPAPVGNYPDLTITSVVPSKTNPLPGELVTLTTTIKNQGNVAITGSNYIYMGYYYDRTTPPTTTTSYNGSTLFITILNPGQSTTVNRNVSFSTTGTHNVWVQVDRNGTISESNETNNVFGPVNLNVGGTALKQTQPTLAKNFIKDFLTNIFNKFTVKEAIAQTAPAQFVSTFNYDPLGRLLKATYPDQSQYNYTFDKADNRSSQNINGAVVNYTYDADNKLTQTENNLYYYDNNGNQTRVAPQAFLGDKLFTFDFENRLTKYQAPNNLIYSYKYDGQGNRLEKRSYDTTSGEANAVGDRFVVDTTGELSKVIGKTSLFSTYLSEMYLYGLGLISQGSETSSSRMYPLEDGLGNVRLVTKADGNLATYTDYDPFGQIRRDTSFNGMDYKFKGESYESLPNIYYMRARYYDPEIGRFLSKDPIKGLIKSPQTHNPYSFAVNNPINVSDPSGKFIDYIPDAVFIGMDIAECDWGSLVVDLGLGVLPGVPAVAGVAKRTAQTVGKLPEISKAGNVVFKTAHGGRHLEGTDLAIETVESAIKTDIDSKGVDKIGELVKRTINVGGESIEYHAYKLENGTINVGTYFKPK